MRFFLTVSAGFLIVLQAMACQKSKFHRGDAVQTPPTRLQEPVEPAPLPPPDTVHLPERERPADVAPPLFQDCEKDINRRMVADLYLLPENTLRLPDFSQMKATRTVCLKQLDITNRDFTEGFPGVEGRIEWFALDIRFQLNIPVSGDYEFALNSDDGSRLYIDGREEIDNDGEHGQLEKVKIVSLAAGMHEVRIPYFQGPRYSIALELKWKVPGESTHSYIPEQFILRP